MRKFFFLVSALLVLASANATIELSNPPVKASDVYVPIGKGMKISLLELSELNVKDYELLSGKKMTLFDKMVFKKAQKQLKQSINEDGTFNKKKLNKIAKKFEGDSGFHIGGFALGFLLGLIGVLIAYLINDDYKQNRVKWSWIGLGVGVVLYLLLLVAVL
jgi:hypothetical protein